MGSLHKSLECALEQKLSTMTLRQEYGGGRVL